MKVRGNKLFVIFMQFGSKKSASQKAATGGGFPKAEAQTKYVLPSIYNNFYDRKIEKIIVYSDPIHRKIKRIIHHETFKNIKTRFETSMYALIKCVCIR